MHASTENGADGEVASEEDPLPHFSLNDECIDDDVNDVDTELAAPKKKPKWWVRRAGRRGTKSQRRALASLSDRYIIPPVRGPYPPSGPRIDLGAFFDGTGPPDAPATLEVGFGTGEVLVENVVTAAGAEGRRYVGVETHSPSAIKCLQALEARGCRSNVRVFIGDAANFLRRAPLGYFDRIVLTFPDPWSLYCATDGKMRGCEDEGRRILQVSTARDIRRALHMEDDALSCLAGSFLLATDVFSYVEWAERILEEEGKDEYGDGPGWKRADVPDRSLWLPVVSKYEQKAIDEGRDIHLRCWIRIR